MPFYEYECADCGRFVLRQSMSDAPASECPTCGGPVRKVIQAAAVSVRGAAPAPACAPGGG